VTTAIRRLTVLQFVGVTVIAYLAVGYAVVLILQGAFGGDLRMLRCRTPEVSFNAVILHCELREYSFRSSEIIVRRAVRPLCETAEPSQARVPRFG
jgi:hypothetical protein